MQKKIIALAIAAAISAPAFADVNMIKTDTANVTVYGILDAGIVQMTNAGNMSPTFVTGANPTGANQAHGGTVTGMMNGGESQTRLGFKGSEDLGDGDKAFFQLETAFSLANGTLGTSGLAGGATGLNGGITLNGYNQAMNADTSINGQLFNRNAFAGVSNVDLGAISFGRQNSLQLDIIGAVGGGYDPVNAQMFSPINFSGSYGGGGATDNSRVDNAVKYANKFGNVNVNVMYGFGGVTGYATARSNTQFNVGYETSDFGIQLAYQNAKDTTGIGANATPGSVTVTYEDLTSYMIAARYQVAEPLTLKAGFERMMIASPTDYSADKLMTQIFTYTIASQNAFNGNKDLYVSWIGANYQVSPNMKASVAYYDVTVPSYAGSAGTYGAAGTATTSGADRYASAMIEYNLSKRTNIYVAYMNDTKQDGMATTGGVTNFDTYGAGLRFKF